VLSASIQVRSNGLTNVQGHLSLDLLGKRVVVVESILPIADK
jgi:hypothetical protein